MNRALLDNTRLLQVPVVSDQEFVAGNHQIKPLFVCSAHRLKINTTFLGDKFLKAVGTPHDERDSDVAPKNLALDSTTSPAAPVRQGKVVLVTTWTQWLTIQVVDQFNKPLDNLYKGADVFETNDINQDLTADGTYQDPVGLVQRKTFDPIVDKGMACPHFLYQWL